MAGIKDIANIWSNVREIDLRPLRDAALREARIALVGEPGSGRHTLAAQMRQDPARTGVLTQAPLAIVTLDDASKIAGAELIILMVDVTRPDFSREQVQLVQWSNSAKKVLVFCNKTDLLSTGNVDSQWPVWQAANVIYGSANDPKFLLREFVPKIMELLPEQLLSLGRHFPLFRVTIARQLISETCFSNTAYAISTGLAEIWPVLDLPLNITDMVVLTKSQAFLAYKLGLLLGFSTRWQDYVAEFGSVIGGGFLWRQLARQLVGLIPVWGIVPKVAVSYAGTYVVGNAVLQWYLTGRHLSPKQMRALYLQSLARGKDYARRMVEKLPHPRRKQKAASLPSPEQPVGQLTAGEIPPPAELAESTSPVGQYPDTMQSVQTPDALKQPHKPRGKALKAAKSHKPGGLWRRKKELTLPVLRTCPHCGKSSAADASFCQYCGNKLES